MLSLWLLGAAFAGVPEDVATAADTERPEAERREAFARIAVPANTTALVRLARAETTPPQQRWVAVRALGPIGDDASRVALLELLASADAQVRMAALGAIGDRADRSLCDYVVARLADPALLVRAAAIDALARIKDPATLPALERTLQDPSNHYRGSSLWFRRHVVEAIAGIGTERGVAALARALDDADPEVAGAALAGLERIAGFSYAEGRTPEQQRAAWKRWAGL